MSVLLLLQKLARNDELLYLRSSFIDSQCANISVEPFNHIPVHESRAAVNLHGIIDYATGCFRGIKLCLACFTTNARGPAVFQMGGAVDQKSGGVELRNHVREFLLNKLMFHEQTAKLFATSCIAQGFIEGTPRLAAWRGVPSMKPCAMQLEAIT